MTDKEFEEVVKKEPFLYASYEPMYGLYFKDVPLGQEIKNGKVVEIKKAKLFGIDKIDQGFICDDVEQFEILSRLIKKLAVSEESLKRFGIGDNVLNYLKIADDLLIMWIAIPVRSYCEYFSKRSPKKLDVLDIESLRNWKINITDYLKHQ